MLSQSQSRYAHSVRGALVLWLNTAIRNALEKGNQILLAVQGLVVVFLVGFRLEIKGDQLGELQLAVGKGDTKGCEVLVSLLFGAILVRAGGTERRESRGVRKEPAREGQSPVSMLLTMKSVLN